MFETGNTRPELFAPLEVLLFGGVELLGISMGFFCGSKWMKTLI